MGRSYNYLSQPHHQSWLILHEAATWKREEPNFSLVKYHRWPRRKICFPWDLWLFTHKIHHSKSPLGSRYWNFGLTIEENRSRCSTAKSLTHGTWFPFSHRDFPRRSHCETPKCNLLNGFKARKSLNLLSSLWWCLCCGDFYCGGGICIVVVVLVVMMFLSLWLVFWLC